MAYKILSRFADSVGGYGSTNDTGHQALGDYSGDPTAFQIRAAADEYIHIERMIVGLEAANFDRGDYYGAAALTNGISIYVTDNNGTILYYLTDVHKPVRQVTDWSHYCYDYAVYPNAGPQGQENAAVRWTFAKSGTPLELLPGWSVNVLCHDNFGVGGAVLTDHHFLFQGFFHLPTIGSGATGQGHA